MRDLGERCGKHRVARLLHCEGIRSQTGYQRRAGGRGGKPAVVAPNHLKRQFAPDGPNQSWVTDITYIRTHEGWLYLAVVLDLFSRQVIGWSMGNCHDNAVAESFSPLLKRERIRRQIYPTRQDARADVFNYIEMFYNPKRRHNTSGGASQIEHEKRQAQQLGSV